LARENLLTRPSMMYAAICGDDGCITVHASYVPARDLLSSKHT
jgi:hypothetical protein